MGAKKAKKLTVAQRKKRAFHAGKARAHKRFAKLCKKYGLHSCHKRHKKLAKKHSKLAKGKKDMEFDEEDDDEERRRRRRRRRRRHRRGKCWKAYRASAKAGRKANRACAKGLWPI